MHKKQRIEKASERLMGALGSGKGLPALMELAGELLENPVALGDISLTVLYASQGMPPDVPMSKVGVIPPDFTTDPEFIAYNEKAYRSDAPVLTGVQYGGYRTMITRLTSGNLIIGYLSVLLRHRPYEPADTDVLRLVRCALEAELKKNLSLLTHKKSQAEEYLLNLLGAKSPHVPGIPVRNNADAIIRLGINKNVLLHVLIFKMPDISDANGPSRQIRHQLQIHTGGKVCIYYKTYMVVLREGHLPAPTDIPADFGHFLNQYNLICGISYPFTQISDLRRHYLQAVEALDAQLQDQELCYHGLPITTFAQIAARQMLLPKAQSNPSAWLDPGICRLKAYDQFNQVNYTQVLKLYIESGKSAAATAELSGLSKSSVYRILERIKQITGETLSSSDDLLHMYFSIQLSQLLSPNPVGI